MSHTRSHADTRFKSLDTLYTVLPELTLSLVHPAVLGAAPLHHRAAAVTAVTRGIEKLERIEAKQPKHDGVYDIEWVFEDGERLEDVCNEPDAANDTDLARQDAAMLFPAAPVDDADTKPSMPVAPVARVAAKSVAPVDQTETKLVVPPVPAVQVAAAVESAAPDAEAAMEIGSDAYCTDYLARMHDPDRDPAMSIGLRRPVARDPTL